jgi:hypothetical protein
VKYWISLALLFSFPAYAGTFTFSGEAAAELRWFPSSPLRPAQVAGLQPSLIVQPEFRWRSDESATRINLIPFVRYDTRDHNRTHADLREAYVQVPLEDGDLLVGLNVVFWGVTESRHLVNIINTTDILEDVDEESKFGQPMVNLSLYLESGVWQAFVMPGFRKQCFPGAKGRLTFPLPVAEGSASLESGWDEAHPDCAFRYSNVFGDWDVGAAYFYGHSREPRLVPNAAVTKLIPRYDLIHQVVSDVQCTQDAWLWKFEALAQQGNRHFFGAAVGGFEYTFYQVLSSNADVGVLAELLYDSRDNGKAPSTIFEHELFLGSRLALNDVQGSQALAGLYIDFIDGELVSIIEGSRRVGENGKISLNVRLFWNTNPGTPLALIRKDDFIDLRLSTFF